MPRTVSSPGPKSHGFYGRRGFQEAQVKGAKLKVQVAIQGDELRVSGKKRDNLQDAIALIKELKITQPLQYVNFRD
jgi:uncharacterized protein YajQ (UPF0234 family)